MKAFTNKTAFNQKDSALTSVSKVDKPTLIHIINITKS